MKTTSCEKCRKTIKKEIANEFYRQQYDIYAGCCDEIAKAVASAFLVIFDKRKYSKKYAQKLFDEFIGILELPEIFGKSVSSGDVIKTVIDDYGIDPDRVKLRIESREEYEHRYKITNHNK